MMRNRADGGPKKRLITLLCVAAIFGFLYVYHDSIFGSSNQAIEYRRSLRKLGSSYLGGDDDAEGKQDESSTKFGLEDDITPKSFPVSFLMVQFLLVYYILFCGI